MSEDPNLTRNIVSCKLMKAALMRKTDCFVAVFAISVITLAVLSTAPAEAKKRYRFYCQGEHLHYGSSNGHKSRNAALRAAIASWAGFTAFEYGDHYANWRIAKNKRIGCGRDKFSKKWQCSIEGTPCRRG